MICPQTASRRPPRRRAAATVEFALLSPVLFGLVLGAFELSRGILVKEALHEAARKACRTAALPGRDNSMVTGDVTDVLTNHGITAADATITILVNGTEADASTAREGDRISVQVSVPTSKVYWTTRIFLKGDISDTVSMMRQG